MDKSFEVTAPVTVTETGSAGALAASPRAALSHADVVLENRTTTNKAATDSAPGEMRFEAVEKGQRARLLGRPRIRSLKLGPAFLRPTLSLVFDDVKKLAAFAGVHALAPAATQ